MRLTGEKQSKRHTSQASLIEMGQNWSLLALTNPDLSNGNGKQSKEKRLTRRHEIVAQLACRGLDAKSIAEQVRLSPKRVREILRREEVIEEHFFQRLIGKIYILQ